MATQKAVSPRPNTLGHGQNLVMQLVARVASSQLATLWIFLGVIVVVIYLIQPLSLDPDNISVMTRGFSFAAFVALGQMCALILGSVDLSVGAIAGFTGIVAAVLMTSTHIDPYLSILIGIVLGTVLGLLNGLLIARLGLNAFITTLATQFVLTGGILVVTQGKPIPYVPASVTWLGQGSIGPVPITVIVFLVAAAILWYVLRRTRFGRHVFAVGGNPEAAKLVGINVQRVHIIIMMVSGTLAAIAGVLMVCRLGSGQPTVGQTWVLPSFAAPILGGTSMSGGVGSVVGTVIGARIMGELQQGVVMVGLSVYWQEVVVGGVLLLAIILDRVRTRRRG